MISSSLSTLLNGGVGNGGKDRASPAKARHLPFSVATQITEQKTRDLLADASLADIPAVKRRAKNIRATLQVRFLVCTGFMGLAYQRPKYHTVIELFGTEILFYDVIASDSAAISLLIGPRPSA